MHHFILVKIKADNRQDALDEAKGILEDSISPENNTAGWDYLANDIAIVDKKYLIQHEHKSFEALEKHWLRNTKINIREHKGALKDILFKGLVRKHLQFPDKNFLRAYLTYKDKFGRVDSLHAYLNYKDKFGRIDPTIKAEVKKALKSKKPKPGVPERLDELAKEIVELLSPQKNCMVEYYFRQLDKLNRCQGTPEPYNTLQCSDHHFADLGGDGKRAYYFIFDRHI